MSLTIFLMGKLNSINSTASEYHFVFCECPSFVREDILDLSKVFSNSEGTALDGQISFLIIQVNVIVN